MDSLAVFFHSLRKENGDPDEEARRSELDSLLRHLTLSEIRRIRVQLSSKPVLDVFDFPSELSTRIFVQLPLEDLFTLRGVSRRWRNILSSPEFCREMIKEHFEPQWKRTNKHTTKINDGDNDDRAVKWFQHSAIARVRRQRGQYHSMEAYWYGFLQQFTQTHYECQYSNGRLGLRHGDSVIQVRSLRSSCVKQFYTDENREPITEFLLSDGYLICVKASPPTLVAWCLDTNDNNQQYHARLPSKIASLSASQNRAAVITTSNEVLIWSIGGPLKALNWSKTKQSWPGHVVVPVAVVFNPDDTSWLYLVSERRIEPGGREVTFAVDQFYESAWKSSHSHSFLDYQPCRKDLNSIEFKDGAIEISSINGLSPVRDQLHGREVVQLVFDIHSELFKIRRYALPFPVKNEPRTWGHSDYVYQFSQGQLLVPTYGLNFFDNERTSEGEIVGNIEGGPHHKSKVSKEAVLMALNPSPTQPTNAPKRTSVAYSWTGKAKDAYNHQRLTNPYPQWVAGDDTFTVLCGRYGYMVWCFDKDIELSTENRWDGSSPAPWEFLHPLGSG